MNLRENLQNLLKKNEHLDSYIKHANANVIVAIVALVVSIMGMVFLWKSTQKGEDNCDIRPSMQESTNNEIQGNETNSFVDEQTNELEVKQDYEELQIKYEDVFNDCKRVIENYNVFLDDLEEYAIIGLPSKVEQVNYEWPSFDDFYANGGDKNILIQLINGVSAKKELVEKASVDVSIIAYNVTVNDYNTMLDAYIEQTQKVSLDFLKGMQINPKRKKSINEWVTEKWNRSDAISRIRWTFNEMDELAADYIMAKQLENPSREWVTERLLKVDDVVRLEAVTKEKDPNGLLSLEGGYSSCIYFTTQATQQSVQGNGPVEKGTDGGGAIEVYASLEDAKCRCEYLGQYDGTLLYSGSYAILGTMVIRTSYLLTNQEQIDLTNNIMAVFTELW